MEFPNLASSVKRMSLEEVVLTISVIGNVFLMPITFVITFVQRRSFFSGKRMTQIKCFHSSLSLCCSFAAIHILIWINLRREYAEYTYELLFLYPYFVIMGGVFFFWDSKQFLLLFHCECCFICPQQMLSFFRVLVKGLLWDICVFVPLKWVCRERHQHNAYATPRWRVSTCVQGVRRTCSGDEKLMEW